MTVKDLFEHSFVVTCDKTRMEILRRSFSAEGLPVPREMDGFQFRHIADNRWWHAPGGRYCALNCYATHLMCVKAAQIMRWPFVAIFEDDAWPRTGCLAALERTLAAAPASGVHLLGWCRRRGDVFCGSHSIIVYADSFQTYIDSHKAELKQYGCDLAARYYAPLRERLSFAAAPLFCQLNWRGGQWMYTRGAAGWSDSPDPGFPLAETILGAAAAARPQSRTLEAPVDIVYAVGDGAKDINDLPLRWSLRSLAKYASGIGRVIVAGRPPAWLSGEAIALDIPNEAGMRKQTNISLCVIKAARSAAIPGPFLYSSDDHYLLSPADLRAWPHYFTGEIKPQRPGGEPLSGYARSLARTREFLESRGYCAWRRACVHLNTWMDARYLNEAERLVRAGTRGLGLEPSCVFNAIRETVGEHPGYTLYLHDLKVRSAADCNVKSARLRPGFSTTPAAERNSEVVSWMNNQYPEPSPWEKT